MIDTKCSGSREPLDIEISSSNVAYDGAATCTGFSEGDLNDLTIHLANLICALQAEINALTLDADDITIDNITAGCVTTGSTLTDGRKYYKIIAVDKFYNALPSASIDETVLISGQAISLTWDVVPEAEYYKIYGRSNRYNQYWVVDKDHVDIDGKIYFIDIGEDGLSDNCGSQYEPISQIDFPEFSVDLSETIDLTDDTYDWEVYSSDDSTTIYKIDNRKFYTSPLSVTLLAAISLPDKFW